MKHQPGDDSPKERSHHNNDGRQQIKSGKTRKQVKRIARKLGIPYKHGRPR
jgi:hypothetical protein